MWIKELQEQIKKQRNYEDLIVQLGLYTDQENVVRCKARLENTSSCIEMGNPISLPRDHHITRLIVDFAHKEVNDGRIKETLTEVRSKYWIPEADNS